MGIPSGIVGGQDSGDDVHGRPVAPRTMTLLAGCFALGIAIGWHQPWPLVWPWLGAATLAAAGALWWSIRRRRGSAWLMGLAVVGVSVAWLTVRQHHVSRDDLAAWAGEEPILVRVGGVATGAPMRRLRTSGSMARFDYRMPGTYFPMRVETLLPRDGAARVVRGRVYVRVEETVRPFHAGDRIEVMGFLTRLPRPSNPGQFDFQRYARSLGQAGMLTVPRRGLIEVRPAERTRLGDRWLRWRDAVRRRASGWLLSDLPEPERAQRDAVLAALLLGKQEPKLEGLDQAFRRVGLAHLLAISGLHLGVLAGVVLLVARLVTGGQRWQGLVVIATVLLYLFVVEVRLPVLRAAVMTVVAASGLLIGRRLHVGGLVALSAVALLLWRPDQLFTAGFQLSFGVVLGLIHLAPVVRRRWFGARDVEAHTTGSMLGAWCRTAVASAVTAWAVATPLTAYHFGVISPLAAPLSVLALPLVSLLLAVGYLKMLLALFLPSVALLLGVGLSVTAEMLITTVQAIDALPFSVVRVPQPGVWWPVAALVWVVAWALRRRGQQVRWLGAGALALVLWLSWPALPVGAAPALRVDELSVGNGACTVIRSGGETVLFEAGSSTDLDAGRRLIIPALRRLGVRSIDAIIISHPDLDHYSAVAELAEEFRVARVLLTRQFLAETDSEPGGPVAFVVDALSRRGVSIQEVGAGDGQRFGHARFTWLHPRPEQRFERANDASMVILVQCANRRVLLCGDAEAEALGAVTAAHPDLRADVVELPHHGSYHEAAATFVGRLDPEVLLQSTGRDRWRRDRWEQVAAGMERLVTARDGACWLEIDHDGRIRVGRFRRRAG